MRLRVKPHKTSLTVQWRPPAGEACVDFFQYAIFERAAGAKAAGGGAPPTPPRRSDGFSVTVDGLKPETDYEVWVAAVNSNKGAGPAAVAAARTRTKRDCEARAPGAVTDFFGAPRAGRARARGRQQSRTAAVRPAGPQKLPSLARTTPPPLSPASRPAVDQVGSQLLLSWLPADDGGCATLYNVEGFDTAGKRVLSTASATPNATAAGLQGRTKVRGAAREGARAAALALSAAVALPALGVTQLFH
jgi:hypothetical protein